ncbi:hypothetical protein [Devosia sp. 2618]|uniref:hypothetical protein n=1 Tax=Devosia sp. 2618 TaxID=3156454 RepID=UPI00339A8AA7
MGTILAQAWDPLGTVKKGGFYDEYDSYVPRIVHQAKQGATVEELASTLVSIEIERMWVAPDMSRALVVAGLIKNLFDSVGCHPAKT